MIGRGWVVLLTLLLLLSAPPPPSGKAQNGTIPIAEQSCFNRWTPEDFRLKDQTLFAYDGYYYLAAIRSDLDNYREDRFAYARTRDFCAWEDLGTVIGLGKPGASDGRAVWAPYVIEEDGVYFMYYTGVNRNMAQSIMLATSRNPSNPASWEKQGVVFRPNHPGMIYPGPEHWSDARDPMVLRYDGRYYMYYTGRDTSGGIVGVARADRLAGPWQDLGAVLRTSTEVMPESPYVVAHHGYYYLFYNAASWDKQGPAWQSAQTPFGPWGPPTRELLGWAHDFYFDGSEWYSTYVVGDGKAIGVTPVRWDLASVPPAPQIALAVFLPYLPTGAGN